MRSSSKALVIFNLGTRWRYVVIFMLWPLLPREEPLPPTTEWTPQSVCMFWRRKKCKVPEVLPLCNFTSFFSIVHLSIFHCNIFVILFWLLN